MISRKRLAVLLPILLVFLPGCGGGSSSSGGGMVGGGGGGTLNAAIPVDVTAGLDTAGVDITAVSPVSNPPPNATSIGLGTSAANTGTTISRGSTQTVLLFGPGLSGGMQVSITGPADIAISNIQGITATNNTPGVSFTAAVDGNAALGARTVILQNSNNDVTTFSGGLEVIQ